MLGNLFDRPTHLLILIVVVVALFGWKKMPDAARSLGRSMRIFKSEMEEMKKDDRPASSAASSDTVKGETVRPTADASADPIPDPTKRPASDPVEGDRHTQPPL
jgi:sec-independent protein translocase protein TatA